MPLFGGPNIKKLQASNDIEGLIEALDNPKPAVRADAARALGEIGDPRALASLIDLLGIPEKDPRGDEGTRMEAMEAVRHVGSVDTVTPMLQTGSVDARRGAVAALGGMRDEKAFEPLVSILEDGDCEVELRGAAARALGALGDTRAVEPLLEALSYDQVGAYAARGLGELGEARTLGPVFDFFLERMKARLNPALRAAMEARGEADSVRAMGGLVKMELEEEVAALGSFGAAGLERMRTALHDEDDFLVRWGIAAAMQLAWGAEGEKLIVAEADLLRGAPQGPSVTLWVEDQATADRLLSGEPKFFADALSSDGSPEAMAFLAAVGGAAIGSTIRGTTKPNPTRGGLDVTLVLGP